MRLRSVGGNPLVLAGNGSSCLYSCYGRDGPMFEARDMSRGEGDPGADFAGRTPALGPGAGPPARISPLTRLERLLSHQGKLAIRVVNHLFTL